MTRSERKPIPNSHSRHVPGASRVAKPEPAETLRFAVVLRRGQLPDDHPVAVRLAAFHRHKPADKPHLTRDELELYHAADDDHVDQLVRFATEQSLRVVEVSRIRHDVVLEGTVETIDAAFGIELEHFAAGPHRYRAHDGALHMPESLHDIIDGVIGLDEVPFVRPLATAGSAAGNLYTPPEMAKLYRFPPRAIGLEQRIAIVAPPASGYREEDLKTYFEDVLGIEPPAVFPVSVGDGKNDPLDAETLARYVADFNAADADLAALTQKYEDVWRQASGTLEATMDVEIAGAVARGAHIDVYFQGDHVLGTYSAIYAALGESGCLTGGESDSLTGGTIYAEGDHDPHGPPCAVSMSFGDSECERRYSLETISGAIECAANMGVTVCCSSGDLGSLNDGGATVAGVNFPASSPFALACGGTTITTKEQAITDEIVWNGPWAGVKMASGGGVSGHFARPEYQLQTAIPTPGSLSPSVWCTSADPVSFKSRGVPDVSANADPRSGYRLYIGGRESVGAGTSAAAPLWAALVAVLAEALGKPVGWLTPLLYHPDLGDALRDIVRENNRVSDSSEIAFFEARRGWDACTGLGSPEGEKLLAFLTAEQPSSSASSRPAD